MMKKKMYVAAAILLVLLLGFFAWHYIYHYQKNMVVTMTINPSQAEEEHWDLVPMVMVDGKLYLDTGYDSTVDGRCGVMDGEITSSVEGWQQPMENDQSNFGTGYDYQYGSQNGTIELLLNGEWRIYATEEARQKMQFPESSSEEAKWEVTLEAKDVTPTGMVIVCEQSGGDPSVELQTGSWYILEKSMESGWEEVEWMPQEYDVAWTQEAWLIPTDETVEWKVNWEWLYGKLPAGQYRIGKEIMDFRGTGDYDQTVFYAEFVVE